MALVVPSGFPGSEPVDPEFVEHNTGLQWLDGKPIYETTIQPPPLPASGQDDYPHGIIGIDRITDIRGMADNGTIFITLPYVNPSGQVGLWADRATIFVSATINRAAYTSIYLTLRYTKV